MHPERSLELSEILDLMDEEHSRIINGMETNTKPSAQQREAIASLAPSTNLLPSTAHKLELQLNISAQNLRDIHRLLDIAIYELQSKTNVDNEISDISHYGSMTGTLGNYKIKLELSDRIRNEQIEQESQ